MVAIPYSECGKKQAIITPEPVHDSDSACANIRLSIPLILSS